MHQYANGNFIFIFHVDISPDIIAVHTADRLAASRFSLAPSFSPGIQRLASDAKGQFRLAHCLFVFFVSLCLTIRMRHLIYQKDQNMS